MKNLILFSLFLISFILVDNNTKANEIDSSETLLKINSSKKTNLYSEETYTLISKLMFTDRLHSLFSSWGLNRFLGTIIADYIYNNTQSSLFNENNLTSIKKSSCVVFIGKNSSKKLKKISKGYEKLGWNKQKTIVFEGGLQTALRTNETETKIEKKINLSIEDIANSSNNEEVYKKVDKFIKSHSTTSKGSMSDSIELTLKLYDIDIYIDITQYDKSGNIINEENINIGKGSQYRIYSLGNTE